MSTELPADVIYVDLDALLDTRLATLALIHPDFAYRAMEADYFTRIIDSFPDVDNEAFYLAYKERNVETLKASVLTNIFSLLMSFVKSQIEDIVQGGQNGGIEICINTYPYVLDNQETLALMQMVQFRLSDHVSISNIHLDDKSLTPTYCKEHFCAMVRYSFDEWVEIHVEEWMTVKMPSVAFYSPEIYAKLPDEKTLKEFSEMKLDPFRAAEMATAPLFALRLLEINMFCINDEIRKLKSFKHKG